MAPVFRALTPPRQGTQVDGRRSLAKLFREGREPIHIVLVALSDAVELDISVGSTLRRRLRFLTDASASAYAKKLRTKLEARNYTDRRQPKRYSVTTGTPPSPGE